MSETLWTGLLWFNVVVLIYFVLLNTVCLGTGAAAFRALRRHAFRMKSVDLEDLIASSGAPPITLITPVHNAEATCEQSIAAHLTLTYPEYEVFVVNDGSTDATLDALRRAFDLAPVTRVRMASLKTAEIRGIYRSRLHPNLWVIDKEHGGRADALNAGINYCWTPLFCSMDVATLLEHDALIRIARPFLEDASTVAAGGIIRIANGCTIGRGELVDVRLPKGFPARLQVLESLRVFLSGRMGLNALDATLVIPGAFGAFRRATIVAAGGYCTDVVGEDVELIIRLHRFCRENEVRHRISFVLDPVAWTEVPETFGGLSRQRTRWHRGLLESLIRHEQLLLNPKYGRSGLVTFPYFFFLEILGPVVEVLGYTAFMFTVVTGRASGLYVATFLLVAVLFGFVLSVSAVRLEELTFRRYPRFGDLVRLFGVAFVENLGYRQLTTWWRFKGILTAAFNETGWGRRRHLGTEKAETDEQVASPRKAA